MHVSNKFGMLAVLIFGSHTLSALEDILAAIGAVFALLGIMATFAKSWISKLGFVTFRVVSQIIERLSWFK